MHFQSMMEFDRFLGRILNRFSKDIGMIDDMMPMILCDVLQVNCSMSDLTWDEVYMYILQNVNLCLLQELAVQLV